MTQIDARGLSCPQPVILAKQALKSKPDSCLIIVDSLTARENVSRFAAQQGYEVQQEEKGADYFLNFSRKK